MTLIKSLPLKISATSPVLSSMDAALQQPGVCQYLQQNRALLVKVFSDVVMSNTKILRQNAKVHLVALINMLKQLFLSGEPAADFMDLIKVALTVIELGID